MLDFATFLFSSITDLIEISPNTDGELYEDSTAEK